MPPDFPAPTALGRGTTPARISQISVSTTLAFRSQARSPPVSPEEHAGDSGVYGVIDQTLYRAPGTDDQGLSGFARAGGVPNDRNLVNFYADGGLVYKGLVPGRPNDKVGIAAAYARVGDNARGLDADIGLFGGFLYPVRSSETVIEMMYQTQLAKWWVLQPDLQYVINPGGGVLNPDGSLRRNALIIDVRTVLNF
jgi:porin